MRQRARVVAVSLAALLLSCGPPPTAISQSDDAVIVRAVSDPVLTITLPAQIDHRDAVPYTSLREWIPLRAVAATGARVEAGGELARLDADVAALWRDNETRGGRERALGDALQRLRNDQRRADLDELEAGLRGQVATAEAAIAATRRSDADQLAIAIAACTTAEAAAERSAAALERLRTLAAAGGVPRSELRRAEDTAALASAETAAPRLRLEILRTTTNAVTRRTHELERDRLRHALAGVSAQLASLIAAETRAGNLAAGDVEKNRRRIAVLQRVVDDPELRAVEGGVVRQRGEYRPGSKAGPSPFIWVLPVDGLVAVLLLPERWRAALPPTERMMATIHVPALGLHLPARLAAVAAAPEGLPDGTGRGFRCIFAPLTATPELRPGLNASVEVPLEVGATGTVAEIPAWCIADRAAPSVTLADGSERALAGLFLGHRFLVAGGLVPGDRVRTANRPPAGRRRISGVVEAAQVYPIRMPGQARNDGWEIQWLANDGATVAADEVVARLIYVGWRDEVERTFEAEFTLIRAAADLARAQGDVAANLEAVTSTWRQAAVSATAARFAQWVTSAVGSDPVLLERQAAVIRAEGQWVETQARVSELDLPGAEGTVSGDERAARHLRLARSAAALTDARLLVADRARLTGYPELLSADGTTRDAEAAVDRAREAWQAARLAGQSRLAQAQFQYQRELKRAEQERLRSSGGELRAPRAGLVYQRPRADGRRLKAGDGLDQSDFLIMPLGPERRAQLLVPAASIAGLDVGATLSVVCPALGGAAVQATVLQVGAALVDAPDAAEERRLGGALTLPPKVLSVSLALDIAPELAERLAPGSTVYVDL